MTDFQAGVRKGRRTTDHILTLKAKIEYDQYLQRLSVILRPYGRKIRPPNCYFPSATLNLNLTLTPTLTFTITPTLTLNLTLAQVPNSITLSATPTTTLIYGRKIRPLNRYFPSVGTENNIHVYKETHIYNSTIL